MESYLKKHLRSLYVYSKLRRGSGAESDKYPPNMPLFQSFFVDHFKQFLPEPVCPNLIIFMTSAVL